ncbi:MAG: hypothetical protein GY928_26400 [Colwellia sp.]|nr:hypothetical protein [Colwellia sp.]
MLPLFYEGKCGLVRSKFNIKDKITIGECLFTGQNWTIAEIYNKKRGWFVAIESFPDKMGLCEFRKNVVYQRNTIYHKLRHKRISFTTKLQKIQWNGILDKVVQQTIYQQALMTLKTGKLAVLNTNIIITPIFADNGDGTIQTRYFMHTVPPILKGQPLFVDDNDILENIQYEDSTLFIIMRRGKRCAWCNRYDRNYKICRVCKKVFCNRSCAKFLWKKNKHL